MSELIERFKEEFNDKETRHIYADDFLNTYLATQIKVLREEAGWTQAELAERAGMKQERISVLEDVNHEAWTAKTLKRIAKAFDMRLSIKIESFGSFLREFDSFGRDALLRPSFEKDPAFKDKPAEVEEPERELVAVSASGVVIDLFPEAPKKNITTSTASSPYLPGMYPPGVLMFQRKEAAGEQVETRGKQVTDSTKTAIEIIQGSQTSAVKTKVKAAGGIS